MGRPIVREILIRFVANVVDPSVATQRVDRAQLRFGIDNTCRVVWLHGHDGPRPICDPLAEGPEVELVLRIGRYAHPPPNYPAKPPSTG